MDSNNDSNIHTHTLHRPTEVIQTTFMAWRWGYLKTDISVKNSLSFWYVAEHYYTPVAFGQTRLLRLATLCHPDCFCVLLSLMNFVLKIEHHFSPVGSLFVYFFYIYRFRDTVGCGDDLFQSFDSPISGSSHWFTLKSTVLLFNIEERIRRQTRSFDNKWSTLQGITKRLGLLYVFGLFG